MTFTTSTIAVVITTTTALSQSFVSKEAGDTIMAGLRRQSEERWEAYRKDPDNDETIKEIIRFHYHPYLGGFNTNSEIEGMRKRAGNDADENEIPLEREVEVMEKMIREGLIIIEGGEKEDREGKNQYYQANFFVNRCFLLLSALPDYDIYPLFKECLQSAREGTRRGALINYIQTRDVGENIFLRELIEEVDLTEHGRVEILRLLENPGNHRRKGKHENEVKTNVFLNKVREAKEAKKETKQTKEEPTPEPEEKQ